MDVGIILALSLPFLGTAMGSAGVFFMRRGLGREVERALTGFASGVMVAASVWSLIIPAIEQSIAMGKWAFFPGVAGVWAGFFFLLALDHWIPHLHLNSRDPEGRPSGFGRTTMLVLAVALHNLPEGMAVGAAAASWLLGNESATAAGALAVGIALQNIPEGAIISMPLGSAGVPRRRAFLWGVLSGAVEPVGAMVMVLLARYLVPILPYLMSFAAGAMLYVVVEELIPEMSQGEHSDTGVLFFALGFTLMMTLDVALG